MSDTVKIPRPKFPRSEHGPKGRVEHDARGNAVWVKTRAEDSTEITPAPLSIEDSAKGHMVYPEFAAPKPGLTRRR
jgi:hypothetical protein